MSVLAPLERIVLRHKLMQGVALLALVDVCAAFLSNSAQFRATRARES